MDLEQSGGIQSLPGGIQSLLLQEIKSCLAMDVPPEHPSLTQTVLGTLLPFSHSFFLSPLPPLPHPWLLRVPGWFSGACVPPGAALGAAVPHALALLLHPLPPPGNLPACQRRGFGKEAASNHSCGWDVVSILSPSSLLLVPRLIPSSYPKQSCCCCRRCQGSTSAASSGTASPQPARNLLPPPAFGGQRQFGSDPPVRTTDPELSVFRMTQSQQPRLSLSLQHRPARDAIPTAASPRLDGAHPALGSPPAPCIPHGPGSHHSMTMSRHFLPW